MTYIQMQLVVTYDFVFLIFRVKYDGFNIMKKIFVGGS